MSRFREGIEFPEPTRVLLTECGAFVTLHKKGKLRGCIGYVVAVKPLFNTVQDVARSSAFSDPRFPPVMESEIPDLEIEISVLTPLKRITSIDEIEVGTHGIVIKRGFSSGLLLPQVAAEQGWDRDTFLTHTCYKAGLPGDCWKKSDTRIEVFSAIVFNEKDPEFRDEEEGGNYG
ncbi:MAG: AmmeMemoRadiSam system protein A [Spirochaetales bacterium]|nr:AmmeMemoRadiSam system protein A [Spirochaetales bacterium]